MTASRKLLKTVFELFAELRKVSESTELNELQKHIHRELLWYMIGKNLEEVKDTV